MSNADDPESIKVNRSDGITHDLLSVFSTKSNNYSEKSLSDIRIDAKQHNVEKKPEEDHGNISVSRSDGIHHDLIKVFRAPTSDAKGDTLKLERRSLSLGKMDLSFLTSGFGSKANVSNASTNTNASNTSPQPRDSFYCPTVVRIVHMSDTHEFLNKNTKNSFLPHGDILVHTGDFTNNGTEEEFAVFNQWLGSVSGTYHYRVICIGNHDVKVFGNNWDLMKSKLSNATHVLCHEEATILGIRFYSCPWHWGHKSNYTIRTGAPSSTSGRFDDIPDGVQVLLTHGPAYDRLDVTSAAEQKEHWGSRELAEAVRRVRPSLHLHGHVKDSRGILLPFGNSPLTVNSCMSDKTRSVMYACPHVVKAVQVSDPHASGGPPSWVFSLDTLES